MNGWCRWLNGNGAGCGATPCGLHPAVLCAVPVLDLPKRTIAHSCYIHQCSLMENDSRSPQCQLGRAAGGSDAAHHSMQGALARAAACSLHPALAFCTPSDSLAPCLDDPSLKRGRVGGDARSRQTAAAAHGCSFRRLPGSQQQRRKRSGSSRLPQAVAAFAWGAAVACEAQ